MKHTLLVIALTGFPMMAQAAALRSNDFSDTTSTTDDALSAVRSVIDVTTNLRAAAGYLLGYDDLLVITVRTHLNNEKRLQRVVATGDLEAIDYQRSVVADSLDKVKRIAAAEDAISIPEIASDLAKLRRASEAQDVALDQLEYEAFYD